MSRKRNHGRRYEADEWVEFIVDTLEDDGNDDVPIPKSLRKAADEFESAVDEALEKCFERYPPAIDPEDLFAEPETAYEVFQTLSGAGVGIWDGRWDIYYPRAKQPHWDRIKDCLYGHLKDPYTKLENEMMDAVFASSETSSSPASNPSRHARRLSNKLSR